MIEGQGTQTLQGVKVEHIRHHHGRVDCVSGRNGGREELEYDGHHFVSTMPLRELVHALDPLPPADVLKAAQGLRYRDYLTVVLVVDRESVSPITGSISIPRRLSRADPKLQELEPVYGAGSFPDLAGVGILFVGQG